MAVNEEVHDPLGGQLQAHVVPRAEEDPDTGEALQVGEPTAAELSAINKRFALRGAPLKREDVYVLDVAMSGSGVDSHGTWQHTSSLRNYRNDVVGTNEVVMLRHHGGGGMFSGMALPDPIGRWFNARLVKGEASTPSRQVGEDASGQPVVRHYVEVPDPRYDDGRMVRVAMGRNYSDQGLTLMETGYMLRGSAPNGQDTSELVGRINAGVQRDTSIGFTMNPAVAPGAMYRCDVCGHDLFDRRCEHVPLLRYADGEDVVMATASIVNAHQMEGSLVWRGSYRGAFVQRAATLARAGKVSSRQVQLLEHAYGARILGSPTLFSIPSERNEGDTMGNEVQPAADVQDILLRAATAGNVTLGQAAPADQLQEQLATLRSELDGLAGQAQAQVQALGLTAPTAVQDCLRVLGALAQEGLDARKALVDHCVAERVRSRGAEGWDEAVYRKRLAKLDLDDLRDEARDQGGAAPFTAGRVVPTQVKTRRQADLEDETGQPTVAGDEGQEAGAADAARRLSHVELASLVGA